MLNPRSHYRRRVCTVVFLIVLCTFLQGCITATYVPPPYRGYKPEERLPLKAAVYFKPYEGTTPLILATYDFHFYRSDFIRILFGVITVRATTSALPQVFVRSVEIRDPTVSKQIKASKRQNLFGECIEVQTNNLVDRLYLAKKQNLDVLLNVEVAEYSHERSQVRMALVWNVYDVSSSTRILDGKSEAFAANNILITPLRFKKAMMESQRICRSVAHECVENMIKSISTDLLNLPEFSIGKESES